SYRRSSDLIHHVRLDQGARRAGLEAARAGTAAVRRRQVGFQFEAGQHYAKEKPRALGFVNQASVLAHPADARIPSEGPLDNRPGVRVNASLDSRVERFDRAAQALQLR